MPLDRFLRIYLNETARFKDRAVLLWALLTLGAATLAIVEPNPVASISAIVLIGIFPSSIELVRRAILILVALCTLLTGSLLLAIAVPLSLLWSGYVVAGTLAFLTLPAVRILSHHFQNVPDITTWSLHFGTIVVLFLPVAIVAIVFFQQLRIRGSTLLLGTTLACLFCIDLSAPRWVNFEVITSPAFRTLVVLAPIAFAFFWLTKLVAVVSPRADFAAIKLSPLRFLAGGLVIGLLSTVFIPSRPIEGIQFDEAHGRWETVLSSFGPNDFGRGANYTYSLLYGYAQRLVASASVLNSEDESLPSQSSLFVLKMPSVALSSEFSHRLEDWVRSGGRVLVIADHTDLYDSAQNLNDFLKRFGLQVGVDAVFDAQGRPNRPTSDRLEALFGVVTASGVAWPWQTGSSPSRLPANAVALASYGASFSEPADYSRPNRFGPFVPRTTLRYGNHTSVVGLGLGTGAIAVVFDSTPWSNFSLFVEQYKSLFRTVIHALSNPVALTIFGWSGILLATCVLVLAIFPYRWLFFVGGFLMGLTLGSSAQIGFASLEPQREGRDYGLKVVQGPSTKLEFLKQLVAPGERSFTRVISAMSKYDLDPLLSAAGRERESLAQSARWLFLQPNIEQLPDPDDAIAQVAAGRDITVLFSPEQAASLEVRNWLRKVGLSTDRATALALAEDARRGLLNRRGPALFRDLRVVTQAFATSRLKEHQHDPLIQSYTVRPTEFPRTSGLLNIGFSADQFSDDAVGEIWEGIYPSALGRHREQKLAAVLKGEEMPAPAPSNLVQPPIGEAAQRLKQYALLVDGQAVLSGKFPEAPDHSGPPRPMEDPVRYLLDLRGRAASLIAANCPSKGEVTMCETRLLAPDMIEKCRATTNAASFESLSNSMIAAASDVAIGAERTPAKTARAMTAIVSRVTIAVRGTTSAMTVITTRGTRNHGAERGSA